MICTSMCNTAKSMATALTIFSCLLPSVDWMVFDSFAIRIVDENFHHFHDLSYRKYSKFCSFDEVGEDEDIDKNVKNVYHFHDLSLRKSSKFGSGQP